MPKDGAKKRDTKSNAGSSERLVTITPRVGKASSRKKSGLERSYYRLAAQLDQVVEWTLGRVANPLRVWNRASSVVRSRPDSQRTCVSPPA
jgi:hypothetical protein